MSMLHYYATAAVDRCMAIIIIIMVGPKIIILMHVSWLAGDCTHGPRFVPTFTLVYIRSERFFYQEST